MTRILFSISFFAALMFSSVDSVFAFSDFNKTDDQGRRQGYWQIQGFMFGDKAYDMNEIVEEGTYVNDKKEGLWKKYYPGGSLKSEITFIANHPNGPYTIYYPNGKVEEKGNWARNKNTGEFNRFHKNGNPQQEFFFNDKGIRNGVQRYFHENGQAALEVNIIEGKESGTMKRWDENGKLVELKEMHGGKLTEGGIQRFDKKSENEPIVEIPTEAKKAEATDDQTNKAHKFNSNGHNVLYNEQQQVTQVGEFRNGRLWNGKWNRYNPDGILMRIEIYTNGRYVGDGIIPEE